MVRFCFSPTARRENLSWLKEILLPPIKEPSLATLPFKVISLSTTLPSFSKVIGSSILSFLYADVGSGIIIVNDTGTSVVPPPPVLVEEDTIVGATNSTTKGLLVALELPSLPVKLISPVIALVAEKVASHAEETLEVIEEVLLFTVNVTVCA